MATHRKASHRPRRNIESATAGYLLDGRKALKGVLPDGSNIQARIDDRRARRAALELTLKGRARARLKTVKYMIRSLVRMQQGNVLTCIHEAGWADLRGLIVNTAPWSHLEYYPDPTDPLGQRVIAEWVNPLPTNHPIPHKPSPAWAWQYRIDAGASIAHPLDPLDTTDRAHSQARRVTDRAAGARFADSVRKLARARFAAQSQYPLYSVGGPFKSRPDPEPIPTIPGPDRAQGMLFTL